jgi:uncharacterized protein (TIGR00290 family)
MKVVVAWSGGKDSCLACFRTIQGFEVSSLLTMMTPDGRSNFHLIRSDLIDAQSFALGIPLTKRLTTPETYENEFKNALRKLKIEGAEGLVTGDIYDVPYHEKGWLNRICDEIDMKMIRPLWKRDTKEIFHEFVASGFNAIVIRVNTKLLGSKWLGRELNEKFFEDIEELGNVDPCGERGEYHTLVIDGPIFSKRIRILKRERVDSNNSSHLEIVQFEVKEKGREN